MQAQATKSLIKKRKMNNDKFYELGDNRVIYYQKYIIIVSILSLLFFITVSIAYRNINYLFISFFVTVLCTILILLYSKIFCVKYDSNYFYLRNLFFKKRISSSHFVQIKKVKFLDFLIVIVFKERRFILMEKSDDFLKNFLKSNADYSEEMTLKIKENINLH